jgi:hypothetical protein
MEAVLQTRYAAAHQVLVVCDNFNTHTIGAFYEAFDAARVRQLVRWLEFRYTLSTAVGSLLRKTHCVR